MKPKMPNRKPPLSAEVIAALLKVETGISVKVWASQSQPHHWVDYPDGYSVFHSSLNVHTREYPVLVFYKGGNMKSGLSTAHNVLVKAGYAAELPHRISAKGEAKPKVTVETKVK